MDRDRQKGTSRSCSILSTDSELLVYARTYDQLRTGSRPIVCRRPTGYSRSQSQFLPQNTSIAFGVVKLEWYGYSMVTKIEHIFTRFDRLHKRDGQTDR